MDTYEKELKKKLLEITENVDTYYGEFSSLNDISIDTKKMPMIYVDFIGENPIDSFTTTLEYSLYLVAASFSKNEKTRDIKRYDVYTLIDEVNKKLHSNRILDSGLIKLKASKKILDAKTSNAYLVIFQKNLEFNIETISADEGLIDE
ncbi:hypothetical protein CRU86_00060 [Aliarcobacter skirrowii]|uniref:hypothetical protein n=1 Tax=Aliarcobacter skirrowii TaxID=28200 RepID=UPI00100AAED9|nr:hypothetical protein [Aliarcobacter skirrowii]RXJ80805.1 hypothetical protein CRU86_00060 [Aliarcobacter skirrowii]